jgi:hypothetical protein
VTGRSPIYVWALLSFIACKGEESVEPPIPFPEVEPNDAALKRLTKEQYLNSLRDVLGSDLALPAAVEPDIAAAGLLSVGASRTTISAWGVEQYESAAYSLAAQIMDDEDRRASLVPCSPAGTTDDECTRAFVAQVGLRLWRRPLISEETDALVALARDAATTVGDFYDGLEFALAALLQSPNFLYRTELGSSGRYDDFELATRLSFFLWNTTPDDELLVAAEAGELSTEEGLAAQAARMIASDRAREGVRRFFADLWRLYRLDQMNKDPTLFPHFNTDLGGYAREETLLGIERLVFDVDGDYRDLFTTQETFVNRHLAALYGVRASAREGFGMVVLPSDGGRRGFLGQVSFLGLNSHAAASSAVLRGFFIRTVLLCHQIPPPPVNLNTALPEATETARTLRERDVVHLTDPTCAGCHSRMDPIGLGFENFDSIGRWRLEDHGATIDPSGELDGGSFQNAWELAQVVHDHPDLPRCLVENMYQYATGTEPVDGERAMVDVLAQRFERSGFRIKALLLDIVTSPGFRQVKEVAP